MINKFRKWKDLLNSFQQMHGDYTVMLVPHDGKGISRKDMDTAQIKKYAKADSPLHKISYIFSHIF